MFPAVPAGVIFPLSFMTVGRSRVASMVISVPKTMVARRVICGWWYILNCSLGIVVDYD